MKRFLGFPFFLFVFFPVVLFAQQKDILVIESYHAEYEWDISYKEGLRETLADTYNLIYFEMNTKRLPESEFAKMTQLAWDKYQQVNPLLVVLGDDNALKYLGPKFIKTSTPVVYLGINNNPRNYNMIGHKNITGVLERPLLKASIMYIRKFGIFNIHKALILFDSGTTSHVVSSEIFSNKKSMVFSGGIRADIKLLGNYGEWQKTVLNAKRQGYDVIFVGLYHTLKDNDDNHVAAETVLEWTSENTPIPPFCFWDFSVGSHKTIGGYVLFGKEQGRSAGKMALKLLSSKRKDIIWPTIAEKGRFFFSTSQLKKWGLTVTEDQMPLVEYTE